MSKKLKRSAVALVLAATMVFSSQGVLTAFAAGENETSTAVDVSALEPILDKEETDVANESGNENDDPLENVCEICGGADGQHTEDCTVNQQPENTCPVCSGVDGQHEEGCSANQQPENTCPVCGGVDGQHEEGCSANQQPDEGDSGETTCPECGGVDGQHEENCSLAQESDNTPSEEDVAAAKNVSDLIGALPEASTLDPETTDVEALTAQVKAAREAYDKLTDAQKALVEQAVLDKLVALEGALEGLEQVNTIPETDENTVALIGETPYNSMTDALKAVQSNETVVLQKDISESVIYSAAKKENVTIDLNKHTWKNSSRSPALMINANSPGTDFSTATTIKNGSFEADNQTSAAVLSSAGTLKVENVTFKNCASQNAITVAAKGTLQLNNDVTFKNNTTSSAVVSATEGTTLTMDGVKFENNSGTKIVNVDGEAELTNCTFWHNSATSVALVRIDMLAEVPSSVTGCTFSNNNAVNGALHVTGTSSGSTTTTISGCTFTGNKGQNGGAIYVGAVVNIKESNFTGNTALNGGAILVSGSAVDTDYKTNITNCTITENSAEQGISGSGGFGGGVSVQADGVATIDSSTVIHSNTAEQAGADICAKDESASITISPVGEGWKLADCGHDITGWYQDTKGNRWSEDNITEEETALTLTAAALKAAHGKIDTPVDPDPTPGEEQDWDHSKSKTATPLDANYESDVTLSLPSAEEQLESDVVFVLDKSTSTDVEEEALAMLNNLQEQVADTNAKVKVGVVIFNKEAHQFGWYDLEEEYAAIEEAFRTEIISGTNTHAGLLAGKAMLDDDTSVDANRKYLVFVSDAITYMYNAEPTAINLQNADKTNIFAGPDNWNTKYGNNNPPENWTTWFSEIEQLISKDGSTYDAPYGGEYTNYVTYDDRANHAMSIDKALYLTNDVYQSAKNAGYHCYAMEATSTANHPWAVSFMNYLANGQEVSFEDIQNDIFYLLAEGSSVVDVIGYGKDDSESKNDYNFDFVNDIKTLSLTVGGKPLSVRKLAPDGNGTSAYGFYDPNNARGDNDFVLRYYKNGQDGNSDECFVWEINVPVSNFAPVQLTYTVKLTNPQTVEGVYGQYDEDGSEGYTSLYTNKEATLYPVDSNGDKGVSENFPKPTVSYTVGGNDHPGTDSTPDPDPDPDRPSRPNRDDDDDWEPLPDAPVKDKPEKVEVETEVPEETETPTTEQPDKYNPETGDTTTVFAAMALAAVSLGGVVLLGRKKK